MILESWFPAPISLLSFRHRSSAVSWTLLLGGPHWAQNLYNLFWIAFSGRPPPPAGRLYLRGLPPSPVHSPSSRVPPPLPQPRRPANAPSHPCCFPAECPQLYSLQHKSQRLLSKPPTHHDSFQRAAPQGKSPNPLVARRLAAAPAPAPLPRTLHCTPTAPPGFL